MTAKELPRNADEPDPAVQQRRCQVWPNTIAILLEIEVHQLLEKCLHERLADKRVAKVDSAGEAELVGAGLERRLGRRSAADRFRHAQHFAPQCLAELLRAALLARVGREIARRALQK